MIIISHRGNLKGPSPDENHPDLIRSTLENFEVEIDAWFHKSQWYLGHDEPQYLINPTFFLDKMWIHCKNLEAVSELKSSNLNYFWHEADKCTLTSRGIVWCYPGYHVDGAIVVTQERKGRFKDSILGICTDYPLEYS